MGPHSASPPSGLLCPIAALAGVKEWPVRTGPFFFAVFPGRGIFLNSSDSQAIKGDRPPTHTSELLLASAHTRPPNSGRITAGSTASGWVSQHASAAQAGLQTPLEGTKLVSVLSVLLSRAWNPIVSSRPFVLQNCLLACLLALPCSIQCNPSTRGCVLRYLSFIFRRPHPLVPFRFVVSSTEARRQPPPTPPAVRLDAEVVLGYMMPWLPSTPCRPCLLRLRRPAMRWG